MDATCPQRAWERNIPNKKTQRDSCACADPKMQTRIPDACGPSMLVPKNPMTSTKKKSPTGKQVDVNEESSKSTKTAKRHSSTVFRNCARMVGAAKSKNVDVDEENNPEGQTSTKSTAILTPIPHLLALYHAKTQEKPVSLHEQQCTGGPKLDAGNASIRSQANKTQNKNKKRAQASCPVEAHLHRTRARSAANRSWAGGPEIGRWAWPCADTIRST